MLLEVGLYHFEFFYVNIQTPLLKKRSSPPVLDDGIVEGSKGSDFISSMFNIFRWNDEGAIELHTAELSSSPPRGPEHRHRAVAWASLPCSS